MDKDPDLSISKITSCLTFNAYEQPAKDTEDHCLVSQLSEYLATQSGRVDSR
jgi:hypothetical protein